jgi:hypothetical protein
MIWEIVKSKIDLSLHQEKRRNVDLSGIGVIEMPVRSTLGIMSTGHNIGGARLLTTLRLGTI